MHIYACKFQMANLKLEGFVKMLENMCTTLKST